MHLLLFHSQLLKRIWEALFLPTTFSPDEPSVGPIAYYRRDPSLKFKGQTDQQISDHEFFGASHTFHKRLFALQGG